MLADLQESGGAGAVLLERLGEFLPHNDLAWLRDPADDPVFTATFWNDSSPDVWLVDTNYDDFWHQAHIYATHPAPRGGVAPAFDYTDLINVLDRILTGWEATPSHPEDPSPEPAGDRYQNIGPVDGYPRAGGRPTTASKVPGIT